MASTSNIRAFVRWREPTVFSGEHVECIITFKNTAALPADDEQPPPVGHSKNGGVTAGSRPRMERQRTVTQSTGLSRPDLSRTPSLAGSRAPSYSRGHRPSLSLSVIPSQTPHGRTPSAGSVVHRPAPAHGRSLSIMSLGSDAAPAQLPRSSPPLGSSRRPSRAGHGRSASAQLVSRVSAQPSPVIGFQPSRQPSPLHEANTPPLLPGEQEQDYLSVRPSRRRSGVNTLPNTPAFPTHPRTPSAPFAPTFAFPAKEAQSLQSTQQQQQQQQQHQHQHQPQPQPRSHVPSFEFPPKSPGPASKSTRATSPKSPEGLSAQPNTLNPVSRVLSEYSANGTSRTSSEFYSISNGSSETAVSELPPPQTARLLPKPIPFRNASGASTGTKRTNHDRHPETLMMGYAKTMGFFTLDGSLINQAPFEEVKRKGVVGGQGGGGVVGVERSKRESGLFGAFGWGNIGESLGGLLGGGEMSSIKEMRGLANDKAIPLLSTPQSILFVDLSLEPGQSKSYTYRFQLPRGLPPTYKGRAIKVHYHLTIGVQRPGRLSDQQVKHVDVPFRVLGSVNSQGETLGHDLMSPYILLHDQARTSTTDFLDSPSMMPSFPLLSSTSTKGAASDSFNQFLSYADRLLAQPSSASAPLLSPSSPNAPRRPSSEDPAPRSMKEAIDVAILRSNLSSSSADQPSQSSNRFTIARAGHHVAVMTILRPAYRLGEAVMGVIDFTPPGPDSSSAPGPLSSYAINITLETTERIDPSLAMRSASSVQRATKKVHAHVAETVLFAQKTYFRLEIPISATPTFETTGVQLVWRVRVEFTTARAAQPSPSRGLGISEEEDAPLYGEDDTQQGKGTDLGTELLEELGRDERGTVLIARERLAAETFEVALPIRVYGVVGEFGTEGVLGESANEALEI
ncbi:hypothetical protein MBLNU459_g3426t1 [Dothideomycetes sp. NU459]